MAWCLSTRKALVLLFYHREEIGIPFLWLLLSKMWIPTFTCTRRSEVSMVKEHDWINKPQHESNLGIVSFKHLLLYKHLKMFNVKV